MRYSDSIIDLDVGVDEGRERSGMDVTGITSDCSLFCFHVIIGNELTKLH